MQPYGLNKNASPDIHDNNKCDTCRSEVDKKHGKSIARQESKKLIEEQLDDRNEDV